MDVKLLVVYHHNYRGSSCAIEIYTQKTFSKFGGENVWNNDKELIDFFEKHVGDNYVTAGIVKVTCHDKWLILFDIDSDAVRENYIGVVDRETNCDQFVRTNYFEECTDSDENTEIIENRKKAWQEPLMWDNQTSYCGVYKRRYCSQFWGWADGCVDDEPFLAQSDHMVHGITRFDLDTLHLFS